MNVMYTFSNEQSCYSPMMVCVRFFYNRSADAIFNIVVKADESIESPVESEAPTTEYMISLWSYARDSMSWSRSNNRGRVVCFFSSSVSASQVGCLSDKPTRGKEKIVLLQEDDELDATLDAATSGLIETKRDKLIRKGVLTPFGQVKGFEHRIQRSRPIEDDGDKFSLNSVSKTSRSLSALSIA